MKTSKAMVLGTMLLPLVLSKEQFPPKFRPASWLEDETDKLLYEMTMEEFQAQRTSLFHNPLLDWRNNGCTSAPDKPFGYNFIPSCQRHDFCYLNYRRQDRYKKLKSRYDDNFREDMFNECAKLEGIRSGHCRSVANVYHWVSRLGDVCIEGPSTYHD